MKSTTICATALSLLAVSCAELTFPLNRKGRSKSDVSPPAQTTAPQAAWLKVVSPPEQTCAPGEMDYIRFRRSTAKVSANQPTLGIAFSGGGVRSATVNLGVLQGLEDSGVLKYADYLSCVSGGGYIGGWYASHLRSDTEIERLKKALPSSSGALANFSSSRHDLLELGTTSPCRAVANVRNYGGLFAAGRTEKWSKTKSFAWWLGLFAPNLVLDAGAHFQPVPGKFNSTHPFYAYRTRLDDYYQMGWEGVKDGSLEEFKNRDYARPVFVEDINSPGSETPYLICNGALANTRASGTDGDGRSIGLTDTHSFEFARLRCGSPLTGWIPTPLFDRAVTDVERHADGTPKSAEVLAGPLPGKQTKPFPLISAVAASGAALDSSFLPGTTSKVFGNWALTLLNLNLRYQTANFTQDRTSWWQRPFDRLREVTTDRFIRTPESNVLQISDGGHFENLGVYSLLRRDVPVILAFDAGADPDYEFNDLKRLLSLIGQCHWSYECGGKWYQPMTEDDVVLPCQLVGKKGGTAPADPVWHFRVRTRGDKVSDVWFVKNSYRPEDATSPFAAGLTTLAPANIATQEKFPHIGTVKLTGWDQHRFDAYREIGRYLARLTADKAKKAGALPGQ